jgi:hypothetical protein
MLPLHMVDRQEEWRVLDKLFMDSYISLAELFLDPHNWKTDISRTVYYNTKGTTKVLGPKIFELERKWGITCLMNGDKC